MPLNLPESSSAGTVAVDDEGVATVLGPIERATYEGPLFVPHWATCPHADRFRGSRA